VLGRRYHGRVDAKMMSRATARRRKRHLGRPSFACGDLIAASAGWRAGFFAAATSTAFGQDQYRKPDKSLDYPSRSGRISYGLRW